MHSARPTDLFGMKPSKRLRSTSELNLRQRPAAHYNEGPRRYWLYRVLKWPFHLLYSAYAWLMEMEPRKGKRTSTSNWPLESTRMPFRQDDNPERRTRFD